MKKPAVLIIALILLFSIFPTTTNATSSLVKKFPYDTNQIIVDDANGYIYVASSGAETEYQFHKQRILFVRMNDLSIERIYEVPVEDIVLFQNKLYFTGVGLGYIDVKTKVLTQIDSEYLTQGLAVDKNKIYYSQPGGSNVHPNSVYEYDIKTKTREEIHLGRFHPFRGRIALELDRLNQVLYVSLTRDSSSEFGAIDLSDKSYLGGSYLSTGYSQPLILSDDDLFYSSSKISKDDLGTVVGVFPDYTPIHVKDNYVFSRTAIYHRNTFEKVANYPFFTNLRDGDVASAVGTDRNNNVYFVTTGMSGIKIQKHNMNLASQPRFYDIEGHWAEREILEMQKLGIVGGKSKFAFSPQDTVTRAEFTAFLLRTLKIEIPSTTIAEFTDVKPGKWYYHTVNTAKNIGLVGGYNDGTFKPDKTISREEMAVLLVRALESQGTDVTPDLSELDKFKDQNQIAPWAKDSVSVTLKLKLMNGTASDSYGAKQIATRAQSVVTLKRLLDK
ncbi:S-layer homology domain-containing protein [Anaerobacillus alkaliphilus]|uniref:S-layer homology domain-containing protein n=1 Tax=Anaerobacillus alkaliphilus TaxID=1548597 RepID=A0A4Q0VU34_9BACI|nr:S-layer homology domain-containing protein [Anaerobacillus alkaliphilus]RXJ02191.1 S-layer homology domain-containing protein [Anaerobacillus alkaliphilus]